METEKLSMPDGFSIPGGKSYRSGWEMLTKP